SEEHASSGRGYPNLGWMSATGSKPVSVVAHAANSDQEAPRANCHKVVTKSRFRVPLRSRWGGSRRRRPVASPRHPLTTRALKASDPMPLRMLRYADFAILAIALPIFVAAGLPLLGYAGAAGGWLLQRGVQVLIERRARASDDPRTVAGLL